MATRIERLKALLKNFEDTQCKYAEFGAYDTEPDAVFQWLIRDVIAGEYTPEKLPTTGSDWQLYTYSMKCGRAARSLTSAARKVVAFLQKNHTHDVIEACRQFCWRCSF